MAGSKNNSFPGGSRQRVSRAGERVRAGDASDEDLDVIDTWRAAHRPVLNTFQAILRNRTKGTGIVVAQRHKRKDTIFDKLRRLPKMQLGRMDDVAGCRLIFENVEDLYAFRDNLLRARFRHAIKNAPDKYDYLKSPKESGYRGVHDIYAYDVLSEEGKDYKGLLIELQYRTRHQHAWATTVEVVGVITGNQPKFQEGDERFQRIFRLGSEIIARAFEDSTSSLPDLSNADLVNEFVILDGELNFMSMLRGLNTANRNISDKKNVILMLNPSSDDLEIRSYRDATEALRALFELEKEASGRDIVLVRADTSEEVRFAFRNYFSDATEFIDLIDKGCQRLLPRKFAKVRHRGKKGKGSGK